LFPETPPPAMNSGLGNQKLLGKPNPMLR